MSPDNRNSPDQAANSSEVPYFERPLAPAPLPVLAGVVALVTLLLTGAATAFDNDWLAVFGCMAGLVVGAALLDVTGRRAAAKRPHRLYSARRLPTEKSAFRTGLIFLTLVVLLTVVTAQATPGKEASPLPYFLAAGFLFLVLPQLVARRVLRRPEHRPQ